MAARPKEINRRAPFGSVPWMFNEKTGKYEQLKAAVKPAKLPTVAKITQRPLQGKKRTPTIFDQKVKKRKSAGVFLTPEFCKRDIVSKMFPDLPRDVATKRHEALQKKYPKLPSGELIKMQRAIECIRKAPATSPAIEKTKGPNELEMAQRPTTTGKKSDPAMKVFIPPDFKARAQTTKI